MPGIKPKDFYGELLRHVGEEIPFSLTKAKRLWSEALESRQEQGDKSLIVVVDEVQEMSPSMLAELRFAVNHQMDSCSLFPLILAGQPEFRRTLRLKKHEAVAQRIPMQYHLSAPNPEETTAYIRHLMQMRSLFSRYLRGQKFRTTQRGVFYWQSADKVKFMAGISSSTGRNKKGFNSVLAEISLNRRFFCTSSSCVIQYKPSMPSGRREN